jgi:sulfatase modifying factor 1
MSGRRLLRIVVLIAGCAGCSRALPGGGLMVVLRSDGTLQPAPDTLRLQVSSPDGGATYGTGKYALDDASIADPGTYSFPISFAVDSNGDPKASVSMVLTVSSSSLATALETQRYVVEAIPPDEVAELDVVFSAVCAARAPGASSDAGTARACCPVDEGCTWIEGDTCSCDGRLLPWFPAPAGAWSPPMVLPDAGARDSTVASDAADAGEGDGSDGGVGLDASPCAVGATQCANAGTPQRCGSNGQWENEPGCDAGWSYCSQGACVPVPTSCVGRMNYDGCEAYEVPGGPFLRGNDPLHEDAGAQATISGYRLDANEVEVFRFRAFVSAVDLGTGLPAAGAGKHAYLPGGALNGGGDGGSYETGWDPSWNAMIATSGAQWDTNLGCSYSVDTWSDLNAGPNDLRPINCVTWYEAYAFCIWDGGFLPSEAEWNYAAAGGSQQRLYPWGSTDPGTSSEYADYGCYYPQPRACNLTSATSIANAGSIPMGVGVFGQYDLAGNVSEWTLDSYAPDYPTPCDDCAALSPAAQRVFRGGSFYRPESYLYTSSRIPADPAGRFEDVGFRCARAP